MVVFIGTVAFFLLLWIGGMSYMILYYSFLHGMKKRYEASLHDFALNNPGEGGGSRNEQFPYANVPGVFIRLGLEVSDRGLRCHSRFDNFDNLLAWEEIEETELLPRPPFGLVGGVLIRHRSDETPNPLYLQHVRYRKLHRVISVFIDTAE